MENIAQEKFLNDTLVLAGFNPEEDDFETLKQDIRPILNEYLILNLYKLLSDEDKVAFDNLKTNPDFKYDIEFFADKIGNFDDILSDLYIQWQKKYLEYYNE